MSLSRQDRPYRTIRLHRRSKLLLRRRKTGRTVDMTANVVSALREQLGVNLESRKETVEILVIDPVGRIPSQN
jgi:uncharacterized protein (TIGR03435 family)